MLFEQENGPKHFEMAFSSLYRSSQSLSSRIVSSGFLSPSKVLFKVTVQLIELTQLEYCLNKFNNYHTNHLFHFL